MNQTKILQVSEDVNWIGILDHEIITFDIVMETKYGTTYNSYFIDAEKMTVIETVKDKGGKYGRLLANVWLPHNDDLINITLSMIDAGHGKPYSD